MRLKNSIVLLSVVSLCNCAPGEATEEDIEHEPTVDSSLVTSRTMYLHGLEESVTIYKDPNQVRLERASGESGEYEVVLAEDRRVYRERFGALPRDLHDKLSSADANEVFSVNVLYSSPTANQLALSARDNRDTFAAAIAADAQPIVDSILAAGLQVQYVSKHMRVVEVEGPASRILALARDERISIIFDGGPDTDAEDAGNELSYYASDHHGIDVEYSQPLATGSYATGIKVGLIERNAFDKNTGYECGVRDDHIAFNQAQVVYSSGQYPKLCNPNNPDCGACDACYDMGYPGQLKGHCSESHPTEVASLVANTRAQGPFAAARAHIYVPNSYDICVGSDHYDDFLILEGVRTAVASYILCDGFMADIAIRDNDLFIARGAGNGSGDDNGIACRTTANSLCVGATDMSHNVASYSNYVNPWANPSAQAAHIDREEPDVMFVGGGDGSDTLFAANMTNTWGWVTRVGTSYAAPTAAALAALIREECGDAKGWTDRVLRAIFRTAAYVHNPHGSRYSTPTNPFGNYVDGQDGAGWVDASAVSLFCDGPGDNAGEAVFDLIDGDGSTFDAELGDRPPYVPGEPVENQIPAPSEEFRAFTDPSLARDYHVIKYLPAIPAGARIRATISWDACPGAIVANYAVPAVDIDLFLLRVDSVVGNHYTGKWVTGSQSVNDNNEGFDYQVPANGAFAIVAGWPANDNVGCDLATTEPFGYAWRAF